MSKIPLYVILIIFILPTTIASTFVSVFGCVAILGFLVGDKSFTFSAAAYIASLLFFGWCGIIAMWKLYFLFIANKEPENINKYLLAILSGVVVSLIMVISFGGSLLFRVSVIGWPILAAIYFSIRLLRIKKIT